MKKRVVGTLLAVALLLTSAIPTQASSIFSDDDYVTLEEVTEEEEPPDSSPGSQVEEEVERETYEPDYDIKPYSKEVEESAEESITRSSNNEFNNGATATADPNLQTIYNKVGNASVKTYNSYTYNAWMGTKDCTWKVNADGVKNTASNTHKKQRKR